jgi:hypothetical protein
MASNPVTSAFPGRRRTVQYARAVAAKEARLAATRRPGTCPICGVHIGRGIATHLRACRGDRTLTDDHV